VGHPRKHKKWFPVEEGRRERGGGGGGEE